MIYVQEKSYLKWNKLWTQKNGKYLNCLKTLKNYKKYNSGKSSTVDPPSAWQRIGVREIDFCNLDLREEGEIWMLVEKKK